MHACIHGLHFLENHLPPSICHIAIRLGPPFGSPYQGMTDMTYRRAHREPIADLPQASTCMPTLRAARVASLVRAPVSPYPTPAACNAVPCHPSHLQSFVRVVLTVLTKTRLTALPLLVRAAVRVPSPRASSTPLTESGPDSPPAWARATRVRVTPRPH